MEHPRPASPQTAVEAIGPEGAAALLRGVPTEYVVGRLNRLFAVLITNVRVEMTMEHGIDQADNEPGWLQNPQLPTITPKPAPESSERNPRMTSAAVHHTQQALTHPKALKDATAHPVPAVQGLAIGNHSDQEPVKLASSDYYEIVDTLAQAWPNSPLPSAKSCFPTVLPPLVAA